jgi:hypothetical protein
MDGATHESPFSKITFVKFTADFMHHGQQKCRRHDGSTGHNVQTPAPTHCDHADRVLHHPNGRQNSMQISRTV